MKTKYFTSGALPQFSILGLMAILISSCGSHQNRAYQDNDGIYGNGSGRAAQQTASQNLYYKDYFGSFAEDQDTETFTDVENYRTDANGEQVATGNAGWGNSNENITINVYDNNWGYGMWNNYWYGGWGWNTGWGWNAGWGWNSWYGPGWGMGWNSWYGPGWGMGWNNWHGYGWGGYYGNHFHNNQYSYNNGIRGVRSDMYGRSGRNVSDRTYPTGRRVNPNYSSGTRNTSYSGTRSQTTTRNSVRTQNTTRNPNYNTTTTRTPTQTTTRNNSYTPTRSTAPSSGTMRSSGGGGRSGGGSMGGGGRSGGGGGRR